jgi:hypothetical protein
VSEQRPSLGSSFVIAAATAPQPNIIDLMTAMRAAAPYAAVADAATAMDAARDVVRMFDLDF